MHVTLSQQHVVMALQLDFASVFGFEQHSVTDIHGAHIRADAHYPCPSKASTNLSGCRDDDATAGASLAILGTLPHEHAVVEQPDRH